MTKPTKEETSKPPPNNFTWDDLNREVERHNREKEEPKVPQEPEGQSEGNVSLRQLQERFQSLCDAQRQTSESQAVKKQQSSYIRVHVNTIDHELPKCVREGGKILKKRIIPFIDETSVITLMRENLRNIAGYDEVKIRYEAWTLRVDSIKLFDQGVRSEARRSFRLPGKLDPGFLGEYNQVRRNMMFKNGAWWTQAKIMFIKSHLFAPFR